MGRKKDAAKTGVRRTSGFFMSLFGTAGFIGGLGATAALIGGVATFASGGLAIPAVIAGLAAVAALAVAGIGLYTLFKGLKRLFGKSPYPGSNKEGNDGTELTEGNDLNNDGKPKMHKRDRKQMTQAHTRQVIAERRKLLAEAKQDAKLAELEAIKAEATLDELSEKVENFGKPDVSQGNAEESRTRHLKDALGHSPGQTRNRDANYPQENDSSYQPQDWRQEQSQTNDLHSSSAHHPHSTTNQSQLGTAINMDMDDALDHEGQEHDSGSLARHTGNGRQ